MNTIATAVADAGSDVIHQVDGASEDTGRDWSQYVTFTVDGGLYGIEITKVREIKGWVEPTELPNAPFSMRGVLNLRGIVVPIFDLRCQFGRGHTEVGRSHVVVIVALGERLIGILVDAVSDILTLEPGEILPVPATDGGVDQSFVSGLVSQNERMVTLLELEKLLNF